VHDVIIDMLGVYWPERASANVDGQVNPFDAARCQAAEKLVRKVQPSGRGSN
jgi:hypothetical protein